MKNSAVIIFITFIAIALTGCYDGKSVKDIDLSIYGVTSIDEYVKEGEQITVISIYGDYETLSKNIESIEKEVLRCSFRTKMVDIIIRNTSESTCDTDVFLEIIKVKP